MQPYFRSAFPLSPYPNTFQQWRAVALYVGMVCYALSRLVSLVPGVLADVAGRLDWNQTHLALANVLMLVAAALAYLVARRGDFTVAASILIALLLLEGGLYLLAGTWDSPRGLITLWAAVTGAGLLLDRRGSVLAAGAALAVILVAGIQGFGSLDTGAQTGRAAGVIMVALWMVTPAVMAWLVARGGQLAVQATLKRDTAGTLIEIGQQVAQAQFARSEPDTLLAQAAETIHLRFPVVYYVQVFLIEPGSQHATLHAGTGEIGAQLLDQEHTLDVGGLSVIGRVTLSRQRLLIPDFERDTLHTPLSLLSQTRSELAIPLVAGDDVLGALDLHSTQVNAFDQADIAILEGIAVQLAMAVDGLRSHETAQRSQRENRALQQQTQASLREIERLNYQITGRAWADYLRLQADSAAMTLDLETGQMSAHADWTDTLKQAAAQDQAITVAADGKRIVALPIVVRNEVIGAMEFELESEAELPEGALSLVAAVGQRLGLAMENRRLLDETQRIAQREAMINDISADLQAATGVDAIIQRAAHHLQASLAARQVTIRLDAQPDEPRKTPQEKAQA